jgi:hypothetical protein
MNNMKAVNAWFSRTTHPWMREARSVIRWWRSSLLWCVYPCRAPPALQSTLAWHADLFLYTGWFWAVEYKSRNFISVESLIDLVRMHAAFTTWFIKVNVVWDVSRHRDVRGSSPRWLYWWSENLNPISHTYGFCLPLLLSSQACNRTRPTEDCSVAHTW